jgi:hypothetical protein
MLLVQIDTDSGTIYRPTQLDHLQTQTCAQKTIRLVNSEETVLIQWVDMVFVSSITWYLENSHVKVLATTLLLQMIHGGRTDPSLPILMTSLDGRTRETEQLLKKLVMSGSTTSRLLIMLWLVLSFPLPVNMEMIWLKSTMHLLLVSHKVIQRLYSMP